MSFWDLFDSGDSNAELELLARLDGLRGGPKRRMGHLRRCGLGQFRFFGRRGHPAKSHRRSERDSPRQGELRLRDYDGRERSDLRGRKLGRSASSTALDLLGGARYWNQELDLSLAVDTSVDLGKLGLERSGSRAVARSGTLEWVDPFVGLRVRHQLAPGEGAPIPRRYRRLWRRQRSHLATVCRLQLRLFNLAIHAATWPRRLSCPGSRLHLRTAERTKTTST